MIYSIKNRLAGVLLLGALLAVIAPMSLLVSHIDLLGEVTPFVGRFFSLLTDSAGSRGFIVTLSVLLVWSALLVKSPTERLNLLMQLGVILVVGFAAKTGLKVMTESPRPYTELLSHQLLIPNPAHFYQLNDLQQAEVISNVSERVSPWRSQHWLGEKDYSFPSGHTIFVAICLAFFGGLMLQQQCYFSAFALWFWGVSVAYSRLWLGMHRPEDLIGSVVFVAVIFTLLPTFQVTRKMPFVALAPR
jgi:phosphatidylglycerophosphatase B